jgi:hypothetical protein
MELAKTDRSSLDRVRDSEEKAAIIKYTIYSVSLY